MLRIGFWTHLLIIINMVAMLAGGFWIGREGLAGLQSRVTGLERLVELRAVKMLEVTAYSPTERETDSTPYINASMQRVRAGTVAVSRDLWGEGWVFGKRVYIEGLGVYEIADLMHVRWKNRVDIFMPKTSWAREFGLQSKAVALLDL